MPVSIVNAAARKRARYCWTNLNFLPYGSVQSRITKQSLCPDVNGKSIAFDYEPAESALASLEETPTGGPCGFRSISAYEASRNFITIPGPHGRAANVPDAKHLSGRGYEFHGD